MGMCNCKGSKTINFNSDIQVPQTNEEIIINQNINISPKIKNQKKQFVRLKTEKKKDNKGVSAEKILLREKTLNLKSNINRLMEAVGTTKTSMISNSDKKSSQRHDVLKKYSEKNFNSDHNLDSDVEITYCYKDIDLEEEEDRILSILKNIILFQNYSDDWLKNIAAELNGFEVEEGIILYNQGDIGDCFYIIKKGKVEILVDDIQLKILEEGDSFGELSLIQKCIRNESARTLTEVEFYIMNGEIYRLLNENMNRIKIGDIMAYFDYIPWLKSLDNTYKNNLARLTNLSSYQAGQSITTKLWKEDDTLYIVKQGCFICLQNKFVVKKLYQRDYIGENFIFFDDNYKFDSFSFEVFALENSYCYIIHKSAFEETLGMEYKQVILLSNFKNAMSRSKFFQCFFMQSHYEILYNIFKLKLYKKGDSVFRADNNINKKVVLILEGSLVDCKNYDVYAVKGDTYGEEIINANEDLPNDIIADPECIILESNWENIRQLLQNISRNSSVDIFKRINKLKRLPIFSHLSESKLLELCQLMSKEKFKPGEYIFYEKTIGDRIYMIHKGRVRIIQNTKLTRELEEGACFGELSLLNEEKRTASIMAIDSVHCFTLTKEKFLELIDNNMMEYLKKKICLEDSGIKISDLFHLFFIGKGKFGNVYLVHNCTYLYAIKSISRKITEKQKFLSKYLLAEKRLLLSIDHPFIVKLVKTLKTDKYFFFLMEYVNGINMEDYINSRKSKKNVYEAKFYGACLFLVLEYLNSKNIAHRDIKPNNIMIDINGYIKLIDFGTAKKISDFTNTVIGTPHFMAPEILLGKGYSFSCDYWSVGVTLYYIYYGITPFGQNRSDIYEIYKEILHKEINFPEANNSYDLNNLIQQLMNKRINQRLCNLNSVKLQSFYKDFSWDNLIDFKVKPPYIPKDLIDWTNNLKNLNNPFEQTINLEKFENSFRQSFHGESPVDYNKNWVEEF